VLLLSLAFGSQAYAATPIETLTVVVNELLGIMSNASLSSEEKKNQLHTMVDNSTDMQATAQRVVGPAWKQAGVEDKKEFIALFKQVLVNTYFSLLESYTNETVSYLSESIKKENYASVKTNIVSGDKLIPVEYRMIFRDTWKIYDMSPEGISMVRSYGSDYKNIVKKEGLAGLNAALKAKLAASTP
jgi:phospholipid transport system substrate-binding protein